jgi:hypothetical protein
MITITAYRNEIASCVVRAVLSLAAVFASCCVNAQQVAPSGPPPADVVLPNRDVPARDAPAPDVALPDLQAAFGANKSYVIPVLEIVGEEFLLNEFNRHFASVDRSDYFSNIATIRHNLHSSWVVDDDPFLTNQLGHPYQGSIYHGFARSAGLSYWEALAYDFGGAGLWEIAGERTQPSRNDLFTTTVAGSFLGESLFRMASLVLEHGNGVDPFWREVGAAVISPPVGINRTAFPDRMDAIFSSHNPAYFGRLQVGESKEVQSTLGASGVQDQRNEALVDFSMDYGLPGKPGYNYSRPFDYFNFQITASSANGLENVSTRGLLIGKSYEEGDTIRGVWGLYGSYDYFEPQIFRVSTTALSIGTTGQWDVTNSIALQGSALIGAGYAAVGAVQANASDQDYHYGVAPQALLAGRLIFSDKVSIDFTGREYFVSHIAAGARGGSDNIVRADAALTWRIHGRNAITLKYLGNRRDANFPDLGDRTQSRATVGIFYTLLGHDRFGMVDWR